MELAHMILSNLHSRFDRESWRRTCKFTNRVYHSACSSKIEFYRRSHNIDIRSNEAVLCTPNDFLQWTHVGCRSDRVAIEAAGSLLKTSDGLRDLLDDSASETEDDESEYIINFEMTTSGQEIMDILHVYIGDQSSQVHLRTLLLCYAPGDEKEVAWAQAFFRSWINTHPPDDPSAFPIARLISEIYMFDIEEPFRTKGIRRFQADFGNGRFRAYFRNLLMGDKEKIWAAAQLVPFLDESALGLTQDALDILQSRGYSSAAYTAQRWACLHFEALEEHGSPEAQMAFCKTMLIAAIQQRHEDAPVTKNWKKKFVQTLCKGTGIARSAAEVELGEFIDSNAEIVRTLRTPLGVTVGEEEVDSILVLSQIGRVDRAANWVHDIFVSSRFGKQVSPITLACFDGLNRDILLAQHSHQIFKNLLLSLERMRFLGLACCLRSRRYHELVARAGDAAEPADKEQCMKAARAQKLGVEVHCAEWREMLDQKGYPHSWKDILAEVCDFTREDTREFWNDHHGSKWDLDSDMKALREAKEKITRELHAQQHLAQELWDCASVKGTNGDSCDWQMEWAEIPADALWADPKKGWALYGKELSNLALTSLDVKEAWKFWYERVGFRWLAWGGK